MKTLFVLASAVVLFLATPNKIEAQKRRATNVLDESRARVLIGQAPQMQSLKIPWDRVAPVMARSTNADKGATDHTLNRLIKANLVRQSLSVLSYPRISGTWANPTENKPGYLYATMTMQLQMDENTNVVTGSCVYNWGGNDSPRREKVTGTVSPDGSVAFTDVCWSQGGTQYQYQYSENGTTAYLQSTNNVNGYYPYWKLTGTASGKVEVKWYVYTFTPEVKIASSGQRVLVEGGRYLGGRYVEGGRYLVGDVSNLRLVTETMASANFAWQAQLNLLGNILLDGARPSGTGTAVFAKKPDGTWVLLRLERFSEWFLQASSCLVR